MKITVVGGGNIGTQIAANCVQTGHEVTIYTSTPEVFKKHIVDVDLSGKILHEGDISKATFDPEEAFSAAELIFVTFPPSLMKGIADIIYRHTNIDVRICVVPGNGGSECAFRKCIERGNVFFGLERVPGIARLLEKGSRVMTTGYRDEFHVASIPSSHAEKCAELISSIFNKSTISIPNFLNLTMTPSNPIIHTSRLRTLFEDWHEGVLYDEVPLFYEQWDDKASALLIDCDNEVQAICRALPEYQLQYVLSLQEYYESPTVKDMTKKIRSIEAFKKLKTPAVSVGGRWKPDLHSRYFTADFSYGLTIIQQIGRFANVPTPNIDANMDWYKNISLEHDEFRYSDYGINTMQDFRDFYQQ